MGARDVENLRRKCANKNFPHDLVGEYLRGRFRHVCVCTPSLVSLAHTKTYNALFRFYIEKRRRFPVTRGGGSSPCVFHCVPLYVPLCSTPQWLGRGGRGKSKHFPEFIYGWRHKFERGSLQGIKPEFCFLSYQRAAK